MYPNKKQIQMMFQILESTYPNAKCELAFNNPYQLLVAVVLSAQTTDKSVNKALEPLLRKNPNFGPEYIVKLGEEKFRAVIKSIGLANTKAKNVVLLSKKLIEEFNGEVPKLRESLESLAGVGRKTANVVLNVIFGMPTMAVDTHVARLAVRMGLVADTTDRLKIEHGLLEIIPRQFSLKAHHLLIFHGRYHCTARAPKCSNCPIQKLCPKIGINKSENTKR